MSLAKQVRKLNLESENTSFIDEEVVVPSIEEQLEAEEAEAELVEVLDEVEENQDALEESEEIEAEIDDHIAEAEATVAEAEGAVGDAGAEAEGPAAEEGETPAEASEDTDAGEVAPEEVADAPESVLDENGELPVEEVVAAQEALQNILKRTGYTLPNRITVSREDVRSNPLEAYKMNLEDWKELKEKVQAGAKKIWEAIKNAFKWIAEQISKVLPTKVNKLKALIAALQKLNIDDSKLIEPSRKFAELYAERYTGAAFLISETGIAGFNTHFKAIETAAKKGFTSFITYAGEKLIEIPNREAIDTFSIEKGSDNAVSIIPTRITMKPFTLALRLDDAVKNVKELIQLFNDTPRVVKTINDLVFKAENDNTDKETLKVIKMVTNIVTRSYRAITSEFYGYTIAYSNAILKAASNTEAPKA